MSNAEGPDGYRRVAAAADLSEGAPVRVSVDGRPVALVRHEGEVFAVDDRCPHMGFPLSEGSVEAGVLTCHWHHARFELSCGDTFDPWADDVLAYPVVERAGAVYVDPDPDPDRSSPARWRARLDAGLEENLRLVIAKAVVGLDDAGVDPRETVARRDRETVERMLFAAATDHVYLDAGHVLDFCNTAVETLDHVGWDDRDRVANVLASLVPALVDAERSEERSAWRQPVDLADLLFDAYEALGVEDRPVEPTGWTAPEGFDETLLGDDPEAVVAALCAAVEDGATPAEVADRVCHAAATRVARFGTANEFGDWNTVHHTFTYANAVRRAAHRIDDSRLYRGAFDAALSVYLDRFLNTPPAPLPAPGEGDDDRDPEALREALLATFDTEGRVNDAGRLAGAYLDADGDPAAPWRTLGRGLLREDAGFHAIQCYEAGRRQFAAAATAAEERVALVAVARFLAAHFPTRREAEQTFGIATRLGRGETIHE
jgi:nitrite reductase/ring-hydroxylating ferredoxin subunit